MANHFKATPRKVRKFIIDCITSGLTPNIIGSPGIGKSTVVRSVAEDFRLWLIDHRLSTSEPTDMTGLPKFRHDGVRERAFFAPFDIFPLKGDPLPKDSKGEEMEGWALFLDEANAAPRSVQAAAYKLTLDKKVGQHDLHQNVAIIMAGNLATDRAIVNPLSTAMQSRLIHIEMEVSHEEWNEDVAIKESYDPRIIAFLSQYPSKLMDFKPDHHELTFCCPRTWEFVNKLITGRDEEGNKFQKPINDDTKILLSGTITAGVALEFVKFTEVYANLLTIAEIQKDPKGCLVPQDSSLMWAVVTHMMDKIDTKNFDALATYADRFQLPFRILFYRSILIRRKELRTHKDFGKHIAQIANYIFNDHHKP